MNKPNTPLISIVTVTLNCVEDALVTAKSVLNQTSHNFEYIVKDGGSTDGTIEALRSLGINVIVSKDIGIYDAMNQALKFCRGDYIYFLNAGDSFFSPEVLENIIPQLKLTLDIYYGNIFLLPMQKQSNYPRKLSRLYLFWKNINHQALLIKRELYVSLGGFDLHYKYAADQKVLWDSILLKKCSYQFIPQVITKFAYGGFSTSISSITDVQKERKRLTASFFSKTEIILYGIYHLSFLTFLKNIVWKMKYSQYLGKEI
jgi:glycosyltransferase involved in cell wall biosynthesis